MGAMGEMEGVGGMGGMEGVGGMEGMGYGWGGIIQPIQFDQRHTHLRRSPPSGAPR
jgi:hypothetical protein